MKLQQLIKLRTQGSQAECIEAITGTMNTPRRGAVLLRRNLLALRSDCFLDLGRWQEAIDDLTEILKDKPDPALFANRGLALWHAQKPDRALQDFRRALRLNPIDAVTCRNMGRLRIEQGEFRSGLWYLRRAIAIDPQNAFGYVLLGDALAKNDDWVPACRAYIAALRVEPANERALLQIRQIERLLNENE